MLSRSPRRGLTVLAAAALLAGLALAWALPALAHPGRSARRAATSPSPTTATGAGTATTGTAATGTGTGTGTTTARTAVRRSGPTVTGGTWGSPFTLLGPENSDLIPSLLTVSAQDALAVGSGTTNEDAENLAHADLILGSGGDRVAQPIALDGDQQALAVAYLGQRLVLLTGTSPAADTCCSTAGVQIATSASTVSAAQPIVAGLQGTTYGALVPVRGGLLAVVDNQAGVMVARSDRAASFGPAATLAGNDPTPPLMAAAPLTGGGAAVAWTASSSPAGTVTGTVTGPNTVATTSSGYDQPANNLIEFATAGPTGLPGAARLAVRVAAGHQIDDLAMVPDGRGATIAWIESWYTGSQFRSQLFWADLGKRTRASALSDPATAATGLSMASASRGRQVIAFQSCDVAAGTCAADAVLRPHGAAWGPVRSLGPVDAVAFPVAAESTLGQSLVGWIANGLVRAAAAAPGTTDFSPAVRVAVNRGDADLALGFGAGRRAVAAWTQGTIVEKLVGARFTPRLKH